MSSKFLSSLAAHKAFFTLLATSILIPLSGCQQLSQQHNNQPLASSLEITPSPTYSPLAQQEQPQKPILPSSHYPSSSVLPEEHDHIWQRISQGYQLSHGVTNNHRIDKERLWYANRIKNLENIAKSSAPYIHYIVESLEQRNMPLELALLPVIESAYNPMASSSARAAGLWQFMPHTGRNFKLEQNQWLDARRDVTRSTQAAIDYLAYLNKMFDGDWLLTLAAYNSGEGTVGRAIRNNRAQGKPTDYWNLDLPRETQAYIPRLIAVAQIFSSPQAYGLNLPEVANKPYFAKVKLNHDLEFERLAKLANLSQEELRRLNPAFNYNLVQASTGHILVPVTQAKHLEQRLANLKPTETFQWPTYKVRSGDNLSIIAKRQGTNVRALKELNQLSSNMLKVGQVIKLPPTAGQQLARATASSSKNTNKARKLSYKVKNGDNLSLIAARNQVTVAELKQWNSLRTDKLKIGQVLHIHAPAIHYVVRSGDSLYSIASKHKVSIQQLRNWNTLNGSLLRPGQKLTLYL